MEMSILEGYLPWREIECKDRRVWIEERRVWIPSIKDWKIREKGAKVTDSDHAAVCDNICPRLVMFMYDLFFCVW